MKNSIYILSKNAATYSGISFELTEEIPKELIKCIEITLTYKLKNDIV